MRGSGWKNGLFLFEGAVFCPRSCVTLDWVLQIQTCSMCIYNSLPSRNYYMLMDHYRGYGTDITLPVTDACNAKLVPIYRRI